MRLSECVENRLNDVDVAPLIPRADVVNSASPPVFERRKDCAAMVVNVDPVAHILSIVVQWNLFVVQRVGDYERQKLLRKLSWSIVIAAARNDRIETEGVMGRAHEMFGSGFGSRVRTV